MSSGSADPGSVIKQEVVNDMETLSAVNSILEHSYSNINTDNKLKRKIEDSPPEIAGNQPDKTCLSPVRKRLFSLRLYNANNKGPFVVIIQERGKKKLNPFSVGKIIKNHFSDIDVIVRSGKNITVTCKNYSAANNLVESQKLNQYNVFVPSLRVESIGVAYFDKEVTVEEIKEEAISENLSPIIDVQRIKKRVIQQLVDTNFVKITFEDDTLPSVLFLNYVRVKIDPYMIPVRQCYRCFSYGHVANSPCSKDRICRDCGEQLHSESTSEISGSLKVDNDMPLKDFKIILKKLSEESISEIVSQWADIFGSRDPGFADRLNGLRNEYQSFWDDQIKYVQKLKSEKIAKIEALAKETYKLEQALGLQRSSSSSLADVPLVELEDQQIKLLNEYQELKELRIAQFHGLQKRIEELSSILGYTTHLNSTCKDYGTSTFNTNKYSEIPSTDDLLRCSQIVDDLEKNKFNLECQFCSSKEELRSLLNECGIKPFTKIERFACSLDGEIELPCNKENLNNLQEHIQKYVSMKQSLEAESLELRNEIISLSRKMFKNEGDTQEFLLPHQGLRRSVLDELKKKLKLLKRERKETIEELILKQRNVLDDLWTKCCYTAEQRMQFLAYNANVYTEDILSLHEQEVEQLQNFYDNNKEIFDLASQHNELWERHLQLEDMAKRSDRLFHNRGGQLLKEEKERKIVLKKLPTVRSKLINMLQTYKSTEGKDFLYDGVALLESLEQLEPNRQATKEN